MVDDPYFNPVTFQLIQTPASSRRTLEEAVRQRSTRVEPRFLIPIDSAQSWAKDILSAAYAFPPDTPFLAFPQEEGVCDVVRAAYKAGGREIEIAQSFHVISIKVKAGARDPKTSPLQMASEIARAVFAVPSERIHFEEIGPVDNGTWGRQSGLMRSDVPPRAPNWIDEMRWWSSGDEVGFLTLKADGGPTRAVISPVEGMNKGWFR